MTRRGTKSRGRGRKRKPEKTIADTYRENITSFLEKNGMDFDDLGWLGPETNLEDLTDEDAISLWESIEWEA